MGDTIDLAQYLFTRLQQLGVGTIHGVPGDFNLTALDYVEKLGLSWAGNANELNAGYAADGYARIKGISALVTTAGVGELSAINAIGGAYAEFAPVVHIVGTPSTTAQDRGLSLHHSFGDGNFRRFAEISAKVTVAQANLIEASTAADQIDKTLRECIKQSRPVYIELPTNMVGAQLLRSQLDNPIDISIPSNGEGITDSNIKPLLQRIYNAKQPLIIVDGLTSRYGVGDEVDELVRVTGFPTVATLFGKSIIDESYPNFHGVYAGTAGSEAYLPWVQACDLILHIGPLDCDTNTYSFTTVPEPTKTIAFHWTHVEGKGVAGSEISEYVHVKPFLRGLLDRLDRSKLPRYLPYPDLPNPAEELKALPAPETAGKIDQKTFWHRISNFFRLGDIVLAETGTASLGAQYFVLPPKSTLISSPLWLSIGYMLPAAAGAAAAQREMIATGSRSQARTILFEGDGSLQMTAQSISDIIRARLNVTIFVINNNGYTIERWIHGMAAPYNDIMPWRYLEAPNYFGAPRDDATYPIYTKRAADWGELNEILADPKFSGGKGLSIVELIMDQNDAPESLLKWPQQDQKRNSS